MIAKSYSNTASELQQTGSERKAEAHAFLEERRDIHIRRARRAFLEHAIEYGFVTADDVRDAIELPDGLDPKLLGPVPTPFAQAGIVERVGYRNSIREASHARPISVWKLRDRAAAERWLRDNPVESEEERRKRPVQLSLFDTPGMSAGGLT